MSEKDNHVQDLMNVTMEKARAMVDVDSVIGSPITTPDGTTIIPITRVSYGFGAGGSDLPSKSQSPNGMFAGGSGIGVTVSPIAFLVIANGNVRVLQIEPYFSSLDRVIATAPDVVDRVTGFIENLKKEKAEKDRKAEEKPAESEE